MDTKFWGPSGWILLHMIAYKYPNKPTKNQKETHKKFFESLQETLPCYYCRQSLQKFYQQLPIDEYLNSKELLTEWIYLIHNKVNNKLRKQKLLNTQNPSKEEVDTRFKKLMSEECPMAGWKFIYAIAFNYPRNSKGISNYKKEAYHTFFNSLGKVAPCSEFKKYYNLAIEKSPINICLQNRTKLAKWLYNINCRVNKNLKKKDFHKTCRYYNKFRVKSCKKTCRLKNKNTSKKLSQKLSQKTNKTK